MTLANLLELWKNCHFLEHEEALFKQFTYKKDGKKKAQSPG